MGRDRSELIRYIFWGAVSMLLNIGLFQMLVLFGMHYRASNITTLITVKVFSYFTNKKFVFRTRHQEKSGLIKEMAGFFAARLCTFLLDYVGVIWFTEIVGVRPLAGKAVMAVIVVILNYIFSKFFVFTQPGAKGSALAAKQAASRIWNQKEWVLCLVQRCVDNGVLVKHCVNNGVLVFFVSQIVYVFWEEPYIAVGDEKIYKQIAFDLFLGKPVSTFQYPVLYPLLLSVSFVVGQHFYKAMLLVQILFKCCCLLVISRLLKRLAVSDGQRMAALWMISFSPIYFMHSRFAMAENLMCPLLLIAALFHIGYRERIWDRGRQWIQRAGFTAMAAVLALCLYWTKYLFLPLFPVFALYWIGAFSGVGGGKWKNVLWHGTLYTAVVCGLIYLYAQVHALRTGQVLTLRLLKESMGFMVASGPEVTAYQVLPQWKWIVCYLMYAFLASFLAGLDIIMHIRKEACRHRIREILFIVVLILFFIYVAARHSTVAGYNEQGKLMVKLLGRYVAYAADLILLIWAFAAEYPVRRRAAGKRKTVAAAVIAACLWLSYCVLYKELIWHPQENWLGGLRGLENIAFLEIGIPFCVACTVLAGMVRWGKGRVAVASVLLCSVVQILAGMAVREKNSQMIPYARALEHFISGHCEEQATVFCNEPLNYVEGIQCYSFYQVNGWGGEMWFVPVVYNDVPGAMLDERENYFMLRAADVDIEAYRQMDAEFELLEGDAGFVFVKWDMEKFRQSDLAYTVEQSDFAYTAEQPDEGITVVYPGDQNTVLMMDGQIYPAKEAGGFMEVFLAGAHPQAPFQIFDLSNLTVCGNER